VQGGNFLLSGEGDGTLELHTIYLGWQGKNLQIGNRSSRREKTEEGYGIIGMFPREMNLVPSKGDERNIDRGDNNLGRRRKNL